MKKLLTTLLFVCLAIAGFSQTPGTTSFGLHYLEYSKHNDKPLLIYLHGAGEKGNTLADLGKLKNTAFAKYFASAHADKFTILVPQQHTARNSWDQHETRHGSRFVEWAMQNYKYDGRVYVTGHSMGGVGAWDVAVALKDKITAIAVSAGRSYNYNGVVDLGKRKFPAIHFHGTKDNSENNYASGEQVCRWYKTGSGKDILVTYDGAGHGIDGRVYKDEQLDQWFLSHGEPVVTIPEPEPEPIKDIPGEIILRGDKIIAVFGDKEITLTQQP